MRIHHSTCRRSLPRTIPRPRSAIVGLLAALALNSSLARAQEASTPRPLLAANASRTANPDEAGAELDVREHETSSAAGREEDTFISSPIEGVGLFIDGEFVPPPLTVSLEAERVLVNGVEFPTDETVVRSLFRFGLSDLASDNPDGNRASRRGRFGEEDFSPRSRRRKGFGPRSREASARASLPDESESDSAALPNTRRLAESVTELLELSVVCAVFRDQPVVSLMTSSDGLELLKALESNGRNQEILDSVVRRFPDRADPQQWTRWIESFQPTGEFDEFVREFEESITAVRARNEASNAAVRRLRTMSYPLSMVGLVLSVLGFGHLVANKPSTPPASPGETVDPASRQMVNRCLALVVALSLLDLIWTILASQANQMTELNPLGRELIRDPLLLAGFKFLMTGIGAGLLFALRQHRIAQTASWWACLVLTLLTMRWLTFNSMFA